MPISKSIFVHACDLRLHEQQSLSPFNVHRVSWRDRLDAYKTIYQNAETRQRFRSNRAFFTEIRRHLDNPKYCCTIHPMSKIAAFRNLFMTMVWMFVIFTGPVQSSFLFVAYNLDNSSFLYLRWGMRACRMTLVINLVMTFFIGYIEGKTQEIVLDRKRICLNYLKTYFFVDVWIPLMWVVLLLLPEDPNDMKAAKFILYQGYYTVIFRMFFVIKVMEGLLKWLTFQEITRACMHLSFIALVTVHWWSCVLKLITVGFKHFDFGQSRYNDSWYSKYAEEMQVIHLGHDDEDDVFLETFEEYVVHFSVAVSHYLGAGTGRYDSYDSVEYFVFSGILLTGLVFYIYAASKLLEFFAETDISGRKYEELIAQATQYMQENHFPRRLRHRVFKYYDYRYNRNFFREDNIISGLSEHLRMEVVLYSTSHLIRNMRALNGLSKATIGSIVAFLKPEIYLPNDIIMRQDDVEKKFFFLIYGTCAIKLLNDIEMTHIEDGAFVSNGWNLITGAEMVGFTYKFVAIEACQIYTLELEDLRYCCTRYPALLDRINHIADKREKFYSHLHAAVMTSQEDISGSNILAELKRKKILMHGTKRWDDKFKLTA